MHWDMELEDKMIFCRNAGILIAAALVISGCTPVSSEAAKNRTFIPSTGNLRLAETVVPEQSASEGIVGIIIPSN